MFFIIEEGICKTMSNSKTLPILYESEVIIVGGSFSAVSAALALAKSGRKVILIEQRTYLGREITATLRPWLRINGDLDKLPDLLKSCLDEIIEIYLNEIPLKPDTIKLCLEDLLLNAGVKILYSSFPVGLYIKDGRLQGLVIGNKSGRQVILGDMIIDVSETAITARLAGASFEIEPPGYPRFKRTLEFTKVLPIQESIITIPESIGIIDNKVYCHRGYLGKEHILIEYEMEFPSCKPGIDISIKREILARYKGMEIAKHLISNIPAFSKAFLASSSYELCGPYITKMENPLAWATGIGLLDLGQLNIKIPLEAFAGPIPGIWLLQEASQVDRSLIGLFYDPIYSSLLGEELANSIIKNWDILKDKKHYLGSFESKTPQETEFVELSSLELKEPESPQRGRNYKRVEVSNKEIPILCKTEILVVGGGTSGAVAAIAAAKEGVKVALVDMNPGLGGTGTFGGVNTYWFGRRIGFAAQIMELLEREHKELKYQSENWVYRDLLYNQLFSWNFEAKIFALIKEMEHLGVELFLNSMAIGAIVDKNQLKGVLIATRFGIYAILADIVIDATGDGDISAFAGAEYVYGSPRDHVVMWYSLPQFALPGKTQNNFTCMVDVSNIEDYTRAILVGRRLGKNCYDHGIYIAPRESRHIIGDAKITLTDQLLQRHWPDVIYAAVSNHDIKGKSNSYWTYSGLIPPNLEIEIPYRSILPKGLENILVVGKAISADHDALAAIRMQSDLENLGGISGLIATEAVKERKPLRQIDIVKLQKRLIKEGVLSEESVNKPIRGRYYTDEELEELVNLLLKMDKPLYSYSDMDMGEIFKGIIPFVEICTVGPRIIPILEKALERAQTSYSKILIAQALAIYRSRAGVPILISEIERQLDSGKLPVRTSHIRYTQAPPDQAAMPDIVYLLYNLGMTRDQRSIEIWKRLAELLISDMKEEDFKDPYKSIFYYIDSICFGIERLGDPSAIPILERLYTHPLLKDQVVKDKFQTDIFQERRAILELAIGRALARCGSPLGMRILINYLDDNRALLAEQAHTELTLITGIDHGKTRQNWLDWLEKNQKDLRPCPVKEDFGVVFEDYKLNTFQYYGVT